MTGTLDQSSLALEPRDARDKKHPHVDRSSPRHLAARAPNEH